MHLSDNTLILSATDLSKFLSCGHLTLLDRLTALGLQPKPPQYDDPALEALFARGIQHEQDYLDALKAEGLTVIEFEDEAARRSPGDWRQLAAETTEAMRSAPDVIYQGVLFSEPWLGKPDFLRRVDTPSDLGPGQGSRPWLHRRHACRRRAVQLVATQQWLVFRLDPR